MTFNQAFQDDLSVFTMPERMRPKFVEQMTAIGRDCIEFEETVAGFTLFAVAVGPRNLKVEGQRTADALAKAPREVINELRDVKPIPFAIMQAEIQAERNRNV